MEKEREDRGGVKPKIVTVGDPRLRKSLSPVEFCDEVVETCDTLVMVLNELQGAGLAAPQIGIPLPVAVVEIRKTNLFPERPESPLYTFVNPKITARSKSIEDGWEGCFSVPGLMGRVPRHSAIDVEWLDKNGEMQRRHFEGYLARVVQHEIDHLSGTIFLDRMKDMSSITTVENFKRYHHEER